jgi:phosphoglycerol transferase MdoB-like AlkP superfamily enzyme
VIHYALFTAFLLSLTALLEFFGGLSGLWRHKVLELPLLLYLYYLFRLLLGGRRGAPLLAALPLLIAYLLYDGYFLLFGRVFRLSELREVPELLDVLPWYISLPMFVGIMLPLIWVVSRMRPPPLSRLLVGLAPLLLVVGSIQLRPDLFLVGFASAANGIVEWSDAEAVRRNGRLSMMLYQAARREEVVAEASAYAADPEYQRAYEEKVARLGAAAKRRNIHILVLEGFVDPARFEALELNRDPLVPEFRALLAEGRGDLAVSPVFGGYTAQAEFELLCGVPALQQLGTIEFNIFSGAPVHCFPAVLRGIGYRTLATHGYKPNFFNSLAALKGAGFEEVNFAREYAPNRATYLSTGDVSREKYMFDKTLLDQNLDYLREQMAAHPGTPLLNFVLTIYGHFPYQLDESVRPRVIEAAAGFEPLNEELSILLNQLHYRSAAMAAYVRELTALDPEGLILLVSDHLPPLRKGVEAYRQMGYLGNREDASHRTLLSLLDHGRPLSLGELHQHQLPDRLYDLLTAGAWCRDGACDNASEQDLQQAYFRVMAHAVADPG